MPVANYSKALAQRSDCKDFYEKLKALNDLFENEEFANFMDSKFIASSEKEKLINFLCQKLFAEKEEFNNFIKILAENKRLDLIPKIFLALSDLINKDANSSAGTIYSKQELKAEERLKLELSLSEKVGKKISLSWKASSEDQSLKVSLDELGYEIYLSKNVIKNKLEEAILKTL